MAFQASGGGLFAVAFRGLKSVYDFMETTPGAENPSVNHGVTVSPTTHPTYSESLLSTLKNTVMSDWESRCSGDFDSGTVDECVAMYEACMRTTEDYRPLCEYQITEKSLKAVFPDLNCASAYPDWQSNSAECASYLTDCYSVKPYLTEPLCIEPKRIFKKN